MLPFQVDFFDWLLLWTLWIAFALLFNRGAHRKNTPKPDHEDKP
jgi:hypothetical protein